MAVRRKKTDFVVPSESLENRFFTCVLKEGILHLSDPQASTIALLNGYGYGKGTLSRNLPDHAVRLGSGLNRVAVDDPFATRKRNAAPTPNSSQISELVSDFSSIGIIESQNPEEYQLGWEEAMYLQEQFSAISVHLSGSLSLLNRQELFDNFLRLDKHFDIRYFVYKHYRAAGWVVKLGTKVGVDFLLYPLGGPQQAHAQYGVSIKQGDFQVSDSHSIPWPASARVLDSVAKSLLIAMVSMNGEHEAQGSNVGFPNFSGWQLHEVVMSRWQSSDSTKTS